MTNLNLWGLHHRLFEHLTHALAIKVVSPGVTVFGDGPDGGREATFSGSVCYPDATGPWDGYGVIQAKFRQNPSSAAEEKKWVLAQVRKELSAYAKKRGKRKRPQYYILVTNLALSSVAGTGAKDKLDELFKSFAAKIGLVDWRIWDLDQLRAYLAAYGEIRRTYAGWITTGDILAQLAAESDELLRDSETALASFLAKEMLADQYTNLEQAGHTAEDKVPLARVFIDVSARLPLADDSPAETPSSPNSQSSGVVSQLVAMTDEKLDPQTLERWRGASPLFRQGAPSPGRVILVGGPGQGKSTATQYLAQILRVGLLSRQPPHTLTTEVRRICDSIRDQCQRDSFELPRAGRVPLRIILNDFASYLSRESESGTPTLLQYSARMIALKTGMDFSSETLRAWLQHHPFLLILDGLDEVPASSNRAEVLTAIEHFLVDATLANADLMVLATTRPQGYNKEFDPAHYSHWVLSDLTRKLAITYATRLTTSRWESDPERRDKVLRRLARALEQETTQRLMRTPLQITIMCALVDRRGEAAQDLWTLFEEYYNVVYQRELERDVAASVILRSYAPLVHAIHGDIGFRLQHESERRGATDARMTVAQLEELVRQRLKSEGWEGEPLDNLSRSVVEAATTRLVFVVGVQDNHVGFEIRSLQEFMAARYLTDGPDHIVQERLREIAPASSWRNVFVFAASRCFTSKLHLRDTIATVCRELNLPSSGDQISSVVCIGSQLAVELITNGVGLNQPKHRQHLVTIACELAERGFDSGWSDALVPHLREEEVSALVERMVGRLDSKVASESGAAVRWLLRIAETHPDNKVVEVVFTSKSHLLMGNREVFTPFAKSVLCRWLSHDVADRLAFSALADAVARVESGADFAPSGPQQVRVSELIDRHSRGARVVPHLVLRIAGLQGWHCTTIGIGAPPLVASLAELSIITPRHPQYRLAKAVQAFAAQPDAHGLASVLQCLGHKPATDDLEALRQAPWPLRVLVDWIAIGGDIRKAIDGLRRGELGSSKEWAETEARWVEKGIDPLELRGPTARAFPFLADLKTWGTMGNALTLMTEHKLLGTEDFRCLEALPPEAEDARLKMYGQLLWRFGGQFHPRVPVSVADVSHGQLLAALEAVRPEDILVDGFLAWLDHCEDASIRSAVLQHIGDAQSVEFIHGMVAPSSQSALSRLWAAHGSAKGVLRILAAAAVHSSIDISAIDVEALLDDPDRDVRHSATILYFAKYADIKTIHPRALRQASETTEPSRVRALYCAILANNRHDSAATEVLLSIWNRQARTHSWLMDDLAGELSELTLSRGTRFGDPKRCLELDVATWT